MEKINPDKTIETKSLIPLFKFINLKKYNNIDIAKNLNKISSHTPAPRHR